MSTLQVDNIKQKDATGSAITLDSDGTVSINTGPLDVTSIKHANAATAAITLDSDGSIDIAGSTNFSGGLQTSGISVGYRNIPLIAATTVGTTHVGKCLTASTTVTVPNSTMAAGDVVSVFNTSDSDITLALNPTLAYVNGADADSATLSGHGVATVLFIDSTTCVVTGNVS